MKPPRMPDPLPPDPFGDAIADLIEFTLARMGERAAPFAEANAPVDTEVERATPEMTEMPSPVDEAGGGTAGRASGEQQEGTRTVSFAVQRGS